ncbi:MAG TPA: hypothetical protein PKV75_11075 [Desulfobacterales bacterium]|nr:hypothetical protein [Desulfobacterales bacterium]
MLSLQSPLKDIPFRIGLCGVGQNIEGKLHTHAYGKTIAADVDPIEKTSLSFFAGDNVLFNRYDRV